MNHEEGDATPEEPEDEGGNDWPVKGPATPQQAIVAIAFVFVLGVVVGFVLCRTF